MYAECGLIGCVGLCSLLMLDTRTGDKHCLHFTREVLVLKSCSVMFVTYLTSDCACAKLEA